MTNVPSLGMMCRHAYNGNCILICRHSMPHRRDEECKRYCRRMNKITVCIEVEFMNWSIDKQTTSYGKNSP